MPQLYPCSVLSRVLGTEPGFRKWDLGPTALFQEGWNQVCRGKKQKLLKGDMTFCTSATSPHYTHYTGLLGHRVLTKSRASALKGSSLLEAPSLHRDSKYRLTPQDSLDEALSSTPLTLSIYKSCCLRVPALG